VQISIGSAKTDNDGHFKAELRLPERDSPEIQSIQFEIQQKIGNPYISKNAIDTLDKIIETVFLALLATTLGILVAIPLSFFAARNLMQDVTLTLTGIAINLILLPISVLLGIFISSQIHTLSNYLATSTSINLISILCGIGLIVLIARSSSKPYLNNKVNQNKAWIKTGITFIIGILILIILYLISDLLMSLGPIINNSFASLNFIGSFFIDLGDIIQMLLPLFTCIVAFGIASQYAGRLSLALAAKLKPQSAKLVQILLSCIAGIVFLTIIAGGLIWLYQLDNIQSILLVAGGVGSVIGLIFGLIQKPNNPIPIGMVIFYGARTIFNTLRAIEPIIMVIVFVVWVGIGPFAGVLALSMHTIAALAKLYSEQVESILQGPIEAVRATGANRLQTIVYAVIPQIIPPYISLTMDRWDINVRMSTVIGLGGGGGIGFLLIQNINLLNYRQASAQMIAIAIVVATMDYISSKTRQKVI
jgi:ABC-type phosphate/phosphonate transport system permease subunit